MLKQTRFIFLLLRIDVQLHKYVDMCRYIVKNCILVHIHGFEGDILTEIILDLMSACRFDQSNM